MMRAGMLSMTMLAIAAFAAGCGASADDARVACEAWAEKYNALECVGTADAVNAAESCDFSSDDARDPAYLRSCRRDLFCNDADAYQGLVDYYTCAEQTTACEDRNQDGTAEAIEAADSCQASLVLGGDRTLR